MTVTTREVLEALRRIRVDSLPDDLVEAGFVRRVTAEDGTATVEIAFAEGSPDAWSETKTRAEAVLRELGFETVDVTVRAEAIDRQGLMNQHAAPVEASGPRHLIAIASGKGGVGKSTLTANLAAELSSRGLSIGVLDADLYGPSQQLMLGNSSRPQLHEDGRVIPNRGAGGTSVVSMGMLVDPDQPLIWRGPMLMKALEQFLSEVEWGELDLLLIDLPPGTGDVALTLAQRAKLDGALIVTTPQDVALADARKALFMFRKLGVPVLGVIENMAGFTCPSCGHHEAIFSAGGGERISTELGLELIAQVPLDSRVVEAGDSGRPIVLDPAENPASRALKKAADYLADKVLSG